MMFHIVDIKFQCCKWKTSSSNAQNKPAVTKYTLNSFKTVVAAFRSLSNHQYVK